MSREIRNARISSTHLGLEGHGIFSVMIDLDYDGGGQGFGGYALDRWVPDLKRRRGTAWGMEFIARVLRVVGVEKWEDLKGKYVRADAEFTKVHRIGHITADRWFDPDELRDMLEPGA